MDYEALHTTTWEDGGLAGYKCSSDGQERTLDAEWVECSGCGREIKLSWMVTILQRTGKRERALRKAGGGK